MLCRIAATRGLDCTVRVCRGLGFPAFLSALRVCLSLLPFLLATLPCGLVTFSHLDNIQLRFLVIPLETKRIGVRGLIGSTSCEALDAMVSPNEEVGLCHSRKSGERNDAAPRINRKIDEVLLPIMTKSLERPLAAGLNLDVVDKL